MVSSVVMLGSLLERHLGGKNSAKDQKHLLFAVVEKLMLGDSSRRHKDRITGTYFFFFDFSFWSLPLHDPGTTHNLLIDLFEILSILHIDPLRFISHVDMRTVGRKSRIDFPKSEKNPFGHNLGRLNDSL